MEGLIVAHIEIGAQWRGTLLDVLYPHWLAMKEEDKELGTNRAESFYALISEITQAESKN